MSISSEEDVASKVSRSPSRLLFDEDDSSSEHSSTSGPRRRCSFVSNSDRPNVMDIRSNYPDSVCGRSYDLSICSDDGDIMSSNTLQTDNLALEKMGMFEIALSAGLKKNAADNYILSRSDSGQASTKTAATTGKLMTKLSQSFSMKRRSSAPGLVLPTSGYAVSSPGEIVGDNDYSAVKKIKATPQRKAYIRRCIQAAGLFALLSTLVGSFLLLEISDIDPSSIISSFAAKTTSILENLVTSLLGPAAREEETKRYQGPEELGEKRMTQEVPSVNKMIPPQEPPINTNHEYDKMNIEAFRNHQKLSHRIDDDPMRQRMMMQGSQKHESNVFNHVDTSSGLRRRLDENEKIVWQN